MRELLLDGSAGIHEEISLAGRDFHYLVHVLRLRPGDRFPATDGRGGRWECEVRRIESDRLLAGVRSLPGVDIPPVELILCPCLSKGRKMDVVVRQATEAGVVRIVPLISSRVVARIPGEAGGEARLERWQRIAREALQQSGAPRLPVIENPLELEEFLARGRQAEIQLFFHPPGGGPAGSLHRALAGSPRSVAAVIGPEGGFNLPEVDLLTTEEYLPISMANTVLRAETAALFALAAILIVLTERAEWKLLA